MLIGLLLHLRGFCAGCDIASKCVICPDADGHVDYPPGEVAIADSAFKGCGLLKTITIPDSVSSIGSSAFRSSGLTSIVLPSSLTSVGASAFHGCGSLVTLDLSAGSLVRIPDGSRVPTSVRGWRDSATSGFCYGCTSLVSLSLPATLTYIGSAAFFNTGLTSFVLPSSVTSTSSVTRL